MTDTSYRTIKISFLTVIGLLLVFKLFYLNHISFDIDQVNNQLTPLKKYMTPGSAVGFYSEKEYTDLYSPVEYIMAPQIVLHRSTPDTIITIRNKASQLNEFKQYRVIAQSQDNDLLISLITKNK